jgi:rare lipoprotein A
VREAPRPGIDYRCGAALLLAALLLLGLSGCGTVRIAAGVADASAKSAAPPSAPKPPPPAGSGRGGYYQDDGPGEAPPENLQAVPDAEPKVEAYSARANRPYVVFGKTYTPITHDASFRQRGIGSWYGRKFHGQKTSSGEIYDMYKMTAAHPTLPIPSYARVTSLASGMQVIVRINDRGPFLSNRIIDLSYTAAFKLGYIDKGSTELEVERLLPGDIARIAAVGNKQASSVPVASPESDSASEHAWSAIQAVGRPAAPGDTALADRIESIISVSERGDVSTVPPASGFYLQFGAYSQAVNAEAARAELARKWGTALPALSVVQSGVLYRLHGGPFASRAEAAAAAQQMQDVGADRAVIVQR